MLSASAISLNSPRTPSLAAGIDGAITRLPGTASMHSAENAVTPPTPRLINHNHFPTRKRVIFTNFASGGMLRNIPKRGDGLGSTVGRLLTRNVLTEAAGATVGLVAFGGLYALGLGLAALNVGHTANTRINNNKNFKSDLIAQRTDGEPPNPTPGNGHGDARSDLEPCIRAVDTAIAHHKEQKQEAYGLWLATAGSLVGAVGRIAEAAGASISVALPVLTGGIVGAGLAGFGLAQLRNDVKQVRRLKQTNQAIEHSIKTTETNQAVVQTASEKAFDARCHRFFKGYQKLQSLSSINSAAMAISAGLFPVASLATFGAAMPLLGAVVGLSGFLRFTVIEPKIDQNSFKPMKSQWFNIYDPRTAPKKDVAFIRVSNVKKTIVETKNKLSSYLTLRDKMLLRATRLMDIFPFLKGIYHRTFENRVSRILHQTQSPETIAEHAALQLDLMRKITTEVKAFQTHKIDALRAQKEALPPTNADTTGESFNQLETKLDEAERGLFKVNRIQDNVESFSKSLMRYAKEGTLYTQHDLIQREMHQLREQFIHLATPNARDTDKLPVDDNREIFLKKVNELQDLVRALRVYLVHMRTQEMQRDFEYTPHIVIP